MPERTIRAAEVWDPPAGDAWHPGAAFPDAPRSSASPSSAPLWAGALEGGALWAEALGARVCHDLAGPVGTLAGAVELLAEADGRDGEALDEAGRTARELTARLRLLRAAWGGECGALDRGDIADLLPGLAASGRVRVDLSGLRRRYPGPFARVLLNLLLLAVEAVPRGGAVALTDAPCGGVLARIEGPRAGWPPALAPLLARDDPAPLAVPEPRDMQAPLLVALARRAGVRLSWERAEPGPDAPPALLIRN